MKTIVQFRGEEREVEFTATDEESDVNYFSVKWHFPGLGIEEHDALNITAEEEEAICDACDQSYRDYDPGGY